MLYRACHPGLFINRQPGAGRVMLVDFQGAQPKTRYFEAWGDSPALNGWLDDGDLLLGGRLSGPEADQLLLINER